MVNSDNFEIVHDNWLYDGTNVPECIYNICVTAISNQTHSIFIA